MKILYVTTLGTTMDFFTEHIKMLKAGGHTIELASNMEEPLAEKVRELGCREYHIPFSRDPLSRDNLKAGKQLKKLIRNGGYDVIHTHTPNASVIVRLVCRKLRKKGLKVIYTAHGFHFFEGAPKKNWLFFYPVEKLCSYLTDVLITINHEDHHLAKRKMCAKHVVYVPGVGIDTKKFRLKNFDRSAKRAELGISEDTFVMLSVGELNENKNQGAVIQALRKINNKKIQYLIVGKGEQREKLLRLAHEEGIGKQVRLLGYRNDVAELYAAADVFVHPSFREGLPVSVMEAMASGLPVVCSSIRGNKDLADEKGGALFDPHSITEIKGALEKVISASDAERKQMSEYNRKKAERFSDEKVLERLKKIYTAVGPRPY